MRTLLAPVLTQNIYNKKEKKNSVMDGLLSRIS